MWHSDLSHWDFPWCIHIQTHIVQCLNSCSSFTDDPVANCPKHSQCWWGYEEKPGLLGPHRWLTVQWKRLKYKLLYCFTPHGVKWKWNEFCRRGVVRFRWRHNAALQIRTEVTALWKCHQHSFITYNPLPIFFLKLEVWRSLFCSLSLSMLRVVPLYCRAVNQQCNLKCKSSSKQSVKWMAAGCCVFLGS